jgi:hypothetical protein
MQQDAYTRVKAIWNQQDIPVLLRRGKGHKLRMRLPFADENRKWLRISGKSEPEWNSKPKFWELPQNWFNNLVENSLNRYGKLYVIQPYREQEKCAPACWNAVGHECQCQCMGENHGVGENGSGWFVVSDTFATRWSEQQVACRLMTKKIG